MAAPKGHPKWGGNKKGSKHKRTLAEEACHKLGIHPFELLAQKAIEGDVGCIIQLCKHIEPPKKPVEVALNPEANTIRIIVEDFGKK